MTERSPLVDLTVNFAMLSLLAVGGTVSILPDIHRHVVEVRAWMTSEEFVNLFALAQVTPGSNVLVATLVGWKVAGITGALVGTAAMCGPPCAVTYAVAAGWERCSHLGWFRILKTGLVPVTIGLLGASSWLVTSAAAETPLHYLVTAGTAALVLATRINPLWILGAAATLGAFGTV